MKPGPFGQQLTLIEELKAATFLAHARLPSAPLDAQVLGPPFARGFRLAGEAGLTRLNAYGQAVPARWGEYRQLSKASGLTAEERGPVGQAANELFGRFLGRFILLHSGPRHSSSPPPILNRDAIRFRWMREGCELRSGRRMPAGIGWHRLWPMSWRESKAQSRPCGAGGLILLASPPRGSRQWKHRSCRHGSRHDARRIPAQNLPGRLGSS